MKKALLTAVSAFALLSLVPPAHADLIDLTAGTGNVTFTSDGNGMLSVSSAGFTGATTGDANFQMPTGIIVANGTFSLGALSGTTGTESGGVFPFSATEAFSYSDAAGDSLTGTITWAGIKDNTLVPEFFDTLTIATSAGSAAFVKDYSVGSKVTTDMVVDVTQSLATLAGMPKGTPTTGTFSNGEVLPAAAIGVPEPSALALLGGALIAFVWVQRRRFERRYRYPFGA
jgi:hypothetical protein